MSKEMTPQERIEMMKKNLGTNFNKEGKTILKDGKVVKGKDALEHFNTELNELTFEIEELYPLNYEEFKKEFPRTIELVEKVNGNNVVKAVNEGLVIQGWSVETNVDQIIQNIKDNVSDVKKAEEEIALRRDVLSEIKRMKDSFEIDWCEDLFWKAWKIKEGNKRFDELVQAKGETLANKRINTIENIGGIEFLKVLQEEIYPTE